MTTDKSSIHGRMKGSPLKPRKITAVVSFRPVTVTIEDTTSMDREELKAKAVRLAMHQLDWSPEQVSWLHIEEPGNG